jgi:hypothetical protein
LRPEPAQRLSRARFDDDNNDGEEAMRATWVACVFGCVALAGCATTGRGDLASIGKPVDELVDDLKHELAQVHWRIRSPRPACGTTAPREVDLRQGAVVLTLERVAQATIGGDIRLVALPLGDVSLEPFGSADWTRNRERTLTMKLEVGGAPPIVDVDTAPRASGAVAQALNAAIDGFMRSSESEPCIRLSALKLTLVLDVKQEASGGFRVIVPAIRIAGERDTRAVNTLTLEWAHVLSNGFL